VSRPILFLGPSPSHVSDLIDSHQIGRQVEHGDVDGCVAAIRLLQEATTSERDVMGSRAKDVIDSELSKRVLCGRFGDIVERTVTGSPGPVAEPAPIGRAEHG
jgi:hypothetical protein